MKQHAIRFIIALGIVSLFADVTYEGARSLSGPFLATLGASGAAVGFIAGFGELIGYGLRYISGFVADRSRRYWTIVFLGYGVNLAVPLLAFAGTWQSAAALLMIERFGKGIRAPARDALLSHAATHTGIGWGFGLHEAMDQIGALAGPLLVAVILAKRGSYPAAFAVLLVPALCALAALAIGRLSYPTPDDLLRPAPAFSTAMPPAFWQYCFASGLLAFGYVDFSMLAFHFKKAALAPDEWLPVFYAAAMGVDAVAALGLGWWFDRRPKAALVTGAAFGIFSAPAAFLIPGLSGAIAAAILWGAGMGAQESVLRAQAARLIPSAKRASGFGIFHGINGLLWFLGSLLFGLLYDVSLPALALISAAAQTAALILFTRQRDPSTIAV